MSPSTPGLPSSELTVEHLRLQVQGIDEGVARRLAELVAEGLGPGLTLPVGVEALATLHVEVPATPGEETDALSRRIVDAVGRALAAAPSPAGSGGSLDSEGYVL
jgi:hypothetical protein